MENNPYVTVVMNRPMLDLSAALHHVQSSIPDTSVLWEEGGREGHCCGLIAYCYATDTSPLALTWKAPKPPWSLTLDDGTRLAIHTTHKVPEGQRAWLKFAKYDDPEKYPDIAVGQRYFADIGKYPVVTIHGYAKREKLINAPTRRNPDGSYYHFIPHTELDRLNLLRFHDYPEELRK